MQWQAVDLELHEWVNNYSLCQKETITPSTARQHIQNNENTF